MSKSLESHVFGDSNPLTGELIWQHRVNGGSEAIKEKLVSDYNLDRSSTVATVPVTSMPMDSSLTGNSMSLKSLRDAN